MLENTQIYEILQSGANTITGLTINEGVFEVNMYKISSGAVLLTRLLKLLWRIRG